MEAKSLTNRNSSMDIIRIVALFFVISIHFFLNNGFYNQKICGLDMYVMVLMRTLFLVCVPLFMLLTGYLMCKKELSKKYYKGIFKILVVYVVASVACMLFNTLYKHEPFSILKIFDFTGAKYSWYIEMYMGLFLIIPFLNLAYNSLKNKKQKQILILTFIVLTVVPTMLNIFNFKDLSWWSNPAFDNNFQKLFPNWWVSIYPITYYFTGCYIKEFGLRFKTKTLILLFILSVMIFSLFNYYRNYNKTYKISIFDDWGGFESYILATTLFTLLSRVKIKNNNVNFKYVLWKISDLVLGAYLISYVFDSVAYSVLNTHIKILPNKLLYYPIVVLYVFVTSLMASALLNVIARAIISVCEKISKKVKSLSIRMS